MYKKLSVAILTGALFSLPVHAANVVIDPSNSTHNQGDVFSVDVLGKGFTTALDAGGVNLSFDSTILAIADSSKLPLGVSNSVQFKSPWTLTFAPSISDGSLNDALFFADSAPSGNFSIFTVWFEATAPGTSPLTLTESTLNPFAGAGGGLAVSLTNAQVSVVPLPPTAWLFASGLVLLVTQRKIRAQRAA
ncbi:MAG TPA: cohesin domain-containing protein [Marinagarivorans sp.]|nr:cohesin domain-containing protein [Marinagarivorans sp.]HNG60401.1 cohesin domain-containing protein [Cellvibrionaceae bacterium]